MAAWRFLTTSTLCAARAIPLAGSTVRGPEDPDSATRAENPEEELSTDERRISLRVKVPAEDGTAVVEIAGPAVPENGLQAFGDWVLAALEQHADGAAEAARLMIASVFGGASAWPGPGLAGRRRLLRPQGPPSLLT